MQAAHSHEPARKDRRDIAFTPAQVDQQLAQKSDLEQTNGFPRRRFRLSTSEISTIQWNGHFRVVTLTLVTTALVHIERPVTKGPAARHPFDRDRILRC